ncbi:MAG: DNA-binding response regulator, partial [Chitinophagia bacterium]|nr:DNA-binding response regulator [Chitinophagia bacterium]
MSNSIDRILVVDDEQDIVEFISYTLRSKGFEVETASDGNEAIAKALYFKPNLILLDVMMPNKDGKQTLKELKLKPQFANTIIIFLTALSDEKSEIDGLNLGADDYIAKPIKMELLLTRINSALRRNSKEKVDEKQEFGALEINRSQFTVKYQG